MQLNHILYIFLQSLHILLLEIIDLQFFCITRIPCQVTGQYAIKDSPITCRQMDGQKRQQSSSALIYTDYEGRIRNTKTYNYWFRCTTNKAAIKTIPIKEKLARP